MSKELTPLPRLVFLEADNRPDFEYAAMKAVILHERT